MSKERRGAGPPSHGGPNMPKNRFIALSTLAMMVACGPPPPPPGPSLSRAETLIAEGRLQDAEGELDRVLAANIPGERDRGYTQRGCLRMERGNARGAVEDLARVFALDAQGHLCLGQAQALLANHAEAMKHLVPLVDSGQFPPTAGEMAVRAALGLRLVDEGLRLARLVARAHPGHVPALALLAQTQAVTGDPEGALETLNAAGRIDRQSAEVPFVRGNILWAMDKYDEAAEQFGQALEHNPAFAEAARNLGVALIQGGRYEAAVPALEKALVLSPEDLGVMNNLGVALASSGQVARAATLYEEARKLLPDEPRLLNNLVDVYIRLGRLDEARTLLTELVAMAPARANASQRLKDLESFEVLQSFLCEGKGAIKAAHQQLKVRKWAHGEIVSSLERVLKDPIFTSALERKEQECRK